MVDGECPLEECSEPKFLKEWPEAKLRLLLKRLKQLEAFGAKIIKPPPDIRHVRDWAEAVRRRAEAGNLDLLIEHLRAHLSPEFAELAVNAIEGKYRKPNHRPPTGVWFRNFHIFGFISDRLDEGISLREAKALARKKYQVSKFTVNSVCRGHFETKK